MGSNSRLTCDDIGARGGFDRAYLVAVVFEKHNSTVFDEGLRVAPEDVMATIVPTKANLGKVIQAP